jgi:hypothetical protein
VQCHVICARKAGIKACGPLWHKLQAKKPDLVEAVLDGNYDSDITMNPKVNLFSIYDNPLASLLVV